MWKFKSTVIFIAFPFVFFVTKFCNGLLLDIHLPVKMSSQSCVYDEALLWNLAFQNMNNGESSFEAIDFVSHHTPHVTLYLADFNMENEMIPNESTHESIYNINQTKIDTLVKTLKTVVEEIKEEITQKDLRYNFKFPCNIQIIDSITNGAYTMLNIENNACLQYLSDKIVNRTMSFVHFPSPIPDWVQSISDPIERKQKIDLIEKYGSPNVFQGFTPHVTVSYNEESNADNERRKALVKDLQSEIPQKCMQNANFIALGYTSLGGTVLQGPIVDIDLISGELDYSDLVDPLIKL